MYHLTKRCIALCMPLLLLLTTAHAQVESPWGVCAHAHKSPEWQNIDAELLKCQQAGIKWMRVDLQFSIVCATAGTMSFARYDSLLLKLQQYGIQWLPILEGYDSEISGPRPGLVPLYNHLPEWRAFVNACVTRYHNVSKVWEIWNEPDGGFWKPTPNAAQYVPLLKAAYEEIKAVDTACKVMVGGLTGWNADYLKNMYTAGAKGYFDKIAVHPYGYGVDNNARVVRMRNEFNAVLQQNGDTGMPIWISESGGSTFVAATIQQRPQMAIQAIHYALQKLGKDTTTAALKIGIAVSPRILNVNEVDNWRSWLPGLTLVPISYNDLLTVDPKEFQVIIGSEGLNIDQPLLAPLKNYVVNGGLMITANQLPFYNVNAQNPDGSWSSIGGINYSYFRIGFEAYWTKPGIVPANTSIIAVDSNALAGGVPSLSNVLVDRFVSPKNMLPGDTYYPIVNAYNNSGVNVGQGLALFTYGDWKGGILMGTMAFGGGFTNDEQANLLQRMYLSYLSLGVEKIFWYDIHSDNGLPGDAEGNFGLLKWDFSPKPSYNTYKAMTGSVGSAPKVIKRLPVADTSIWALALQKKEDSSLVLAVWTAQATGTYNVLHKDSVIATYQGTTVRFIPLTDSLSTYKIATPATLTLNSIPAKTYGDADFSLSGGSTNNRLPVTFSHRNDSCCRVYKDSITAQWMVKILGAGRDTIVVSQWDNNVYPTADSNRVTFQVAPALLTVTAADASRLYGVPDPVFTASYSGFVNGDDSTVLTLRPVLATTATLYSLPGNYPIQPGGGLASNYVFAYNSGTLKIADILLNNNASGSKLLAAYIGSTNLMANVISSYQGRALFQLVDISGKRVFSEVITLHKGVNLLRFQTSDYTKGLYIAAVGTGMWSLTSKLIKFQ